MARVIVPREARNDLVSIRDYIRDELCNPDAARRILAQLKKSVSSLEHHPGRGKPLDALIAVHTEYRYLICENYCVFYVCMESTVLPSPATGQFPGAVPVRMSFMASHPATPRRYGVGGVSFFPPHALRSTRES